MRKFRVRPEIYPFLKTILNQKKIPYKIISDHEISVELSGNKFHRYVKEAACEKERKSNKHKEIPVLPYEIITNPRALKSVLGKTKKFTVLSGDREKLEQFLKSRQEVYFVEKEKIALLLSDMSSQPQYTMNFYWYFDEFLGYYTEKEKKIAHGIIQTKDDFYLI